MSAIRQIAASFSAVVRKSAHENVPGDEPTQMARKLVHGMAVSKYIHVTLEGRLHGHPVGDPLGAILHSEIAHQKTMAVPADAVTNGFSQRALDAAQSGDIARAAKLHGNVVTLYDIAKAHGFRGIPREQHASLQEARDWHAKAGQRHLLELIERYKSERKPVEFARDGEPTRYSMHDDVIANFEGNRNLRNDTTHRGVYADALDDAGRYEDAAIHRVIMDPSADRLAQLRSQYHNSIPGLPVHNGEVGTPEQPNHKGAAHEATLNAREASFTANYWPEHGEELPDDLFTIGSTNYQEEPTHEHRFHYHQTLVAHHAYRAAELRRGAAHFRDLMYTVARNRPYEQNYFDRNAGQAADYHEDAAELHRIAAVHHLALSDPAKLAIPNRLARSGLPEQYAAFRAPAGGMVVRGSFYKGGAMVPDLEGAFANPIKEAASEQPKRSISDRLSALRKPAKKATLVVSYARAVNKPIRYSADSEGLLHAVHQFPSEDTPKLILADHLQDNPEEGDPGTEHTIRSHIERANNGENHGKLHIWLSPEGKVRASSEDRLLRMMAEPEHEATRHNVPFNGMAPDHGLRDAVADMLTSQGRHEEVQHLNGPIGIHTRVLMGGPEGGQRYGGIVSRRYAEMGDPGVRTVVQPFQHYDMSHDSRAYADAALDTTSEDDDRGRPLSRNRGLDYVDSHSLARMHRDWSRFAHENAEDLQYDTGGNAPYHFWLTRNGHGTGSWDHPGYYDNDESISGSDIVDSLSEAARRKVDRLSEAARRKGEYYLDVGGDGMIHGHGGREE
jgi:uncharacterized protein (TIGR02996 family)